MGVARHTILKCNNGGTTCCCQRVVSEGSRKVGDGDLVAIAVRDRTIKQDRLNLRDVEIGVLVPSRTNQGDMEREFAHSLKDPEVVSARYPNVHTHTTVANVTHVGEKHYMMDGTCSYICDLEYVRYRKLAEGKLRHKVRE